MAKASRFTDQKWKALCEKRAETGQMATAGKGRKIIICLKGLARELYGLTVERITKAYLDKYG